jgi:hypothetical protein
MKNPALERASWIAGVIATVLALVAYLCPSSSNEEQSDTPKRNEAKVDAVSISASGVNPQTQIVQGSPSSAAAIQIQGNGNQVVTHAPVTPGSSNVPQQTNTTKEKCSPIISGGSVGTVKIDC